MSDKQQVKKQLKRKFVVFMTHSEFAESGVQILLLDISVYLIGTHSEPLQFNRFSFHHFFSDQLLKVIFKTSSGKDYIFLDISKKIAL